jgi:aspartyl-tRNA(Asn)/glutamyl-tRNA(Gln) amidotransferase subunit C
MILCQPGAPKARTRAAPLRFAQRSLTFPRSMSKITIDDVKETALLARLELSDEELQRLTRELDAILGYMDLLDTLDVTGVEPTTHAVPLTLPLRDDVLEALEPHLPLEAALGDAPRRQDGLFEVPRIIEVAE